MRVLRGFNQCLDNDCALTIGAFEALHLGHQMVITQTIARAKALGLASAVLTFEPLPREFFANDNQRPKRIYRFSQRLQIIRALEPDYLICLRFDEALANMSADDFVRQVLVGLFNAKHILVGDNFCFGKNRSGNFETLRQLGTRCGFSVDCVEMIRIDAEAISTTRIREVLLRGDFDQCRRLLGRTYEVMGIVVRGSGYGRDLGFATANVHCGRYDPPLRGVFTANVYLDGVSYPAVVNAGVRPTVDGRKYQLEAHLLNFSEDIYGHKLCLRPLVKLRDEKRFTDTAELKQAIAGDVGNAKRLLNVTAK